MLEQPSLEAQQLAIRVVVRLPAAGRRERHDRARAPARGELERDVAAERVPDQVRGLEPGRVHRALDGVGERLAGERALDRRAAGVAGQRQRQDIVAALERRQHELPDPPGVEEAVQADHRRPGAPAMRRREHTAAE